MSQSGVQIIEYDHSYAEQVAKMWNDSNDSWGGEREPRTADNVRQEEETGGYLHTFLAIEGDEVVGYCNLVQFLEDPQALQLFLLNVVPSHQGRGIGKRLILKALERTREMGYTRLDLFTWAGNLKAVPLYKKCGFLWEKADGAVHLINLIPLLLQTEALQEEFTWFDWYQDNRRELKVEPDGREADDYHYLEYLWERGGRRLRVEIDRTSRGIRLIETDDYLISATPTAHKLVYGAEYPVTYEIRNKSGRPLMVEISGGQDDSIENEIEARLEVTGSASLVSTCRVGAAEKPVDLATYPAAVADVRLNGKAARLKVGIEAQPPAECQLLVPGGYLRSGEQTVYMNVGSNLSEAASFCFQLPEFPGGSFAQRTAQIGLRAGEKGCIALPLTLQSGIAFSGQMEAVARLESGGQITFHYDAHLLVPSYQGRGGAEQEDGWRIINGQYAVELTKREGRLRVLSPQSGPYSTIISAPLLGKPYQDVLLNITPRVHWFPDGAEMVLEAVYQLEKPTSLELTYLCRLAADGLVSQQYRVRNRGDEATGDLHLLQSYYYSYDGRAVAPYGDGYLKFPNTGLSWLEPALYRENWIFYPRPAQPVGIGWPTSCHPSFDGWMIYLEGHAAPLAPGASWQTEPVWLSLGAIATWQEWRAFTTQQPVNRTLNARDHLELEVNAGNPFVTREFTARVRQHRAEPLEGRFSLQARRGSCASAELVSSGAEAGEPVTFQLPAESGHHWDQLCLTADLPKSLERRRATVFYTDKSRAVATTTSSVQGQQVFVADNGVLQIRVAPSFAHNLFSLQYQGDEWLYSSFPQPRPMSWWNPWVGGLGSAPTHFRFEDQLKEERAVDFVRREDCWGNIWQGLLVTLRVRRHQRYRGLDLRQHYLLLPGLPLLCCYTEVAQTGGHYIKDVRLMTQVFPALGDLRQAWFEYDDDQGERIRQKGGFLQGCETVTPIRFGVQGRDSSLLLISHPQATFRFFEGTAEAVTTGTAQTIEGPGGSVIRTVPTFLFFADEYLTNKELQPLFSLSFK
ncbi:MAG: GNAT family N-acetyltransferase [Bacillota bacterium]